MKVQEYAVCMGSVQKQVMQSPPPRVGISAHPSPQLCLVSYALLCACCSVHDDFWANETSDTASLRRNPDGHGSSVVLFCQFGVVTSS